ncbi:hypothetical protein BDZ91DRAFT_708500 [Kalaharituber pfeilii]|nr:hypothetical protein BDZ91DRAFT_708500 [Kalaharituber pfeilii]
MPERTMLQTPPIPPPHQASAFSSLSSDFRISASPTITFLLCLLLQMQCIFSVHRNSHVFFFLTKRFDFSIILVWSNRSLFFVSLQLLFSI